MRAIYRIKFEQRITWFELKSLTSLEMEQTLERMGKADFDFSVKSFFNSVGNRFTANLNYDFNDPELTPSLTFPLYTFGEIPSSGSSASTWNMD